MGDLLSFHALLRLLAARSGQLLDLSDAARDPGVAVNTAKAWLPALEAAYQVTVPGPYFADVGRRLVKTPKVYCTDTGTLCHLAGLKDAEHAAQGPMGGAILETAVLAELVRRLAHRGEDPPICFRRSSSGEEADLLVETGGRLVPIEVKVSATPTPAMAGALAAFGGRFGAKVRRAYLVHPGDARPALAPGIEAIPCRAI